MRIIANFSDDWDLQRFHINPLNECLTDRASNAKKLTMTELIDQLVTAERHGKAPIEFACKHCEATSE